MRSLCWEEPGFTFPQRYRCILARHAFGVFEEPREDHFVSLTGIEMPFNDVSVFSMQNFPVSCLQSQIF